MSLSAGSKFGSYKITESFGMGGMGTVYRARDILLNCEVAIKVLLPQFSRDPEWLRRFRHEAQTLAALNHPNILTVHDFGEHDGSLYIVTELLEGETLRERLRSGVLPIQEATEYAEQIVSGLAAAHDKGFAHCDLKPENIFLTRGGWLKVDDA